MKLIAVLFVVFTTTLSQDKDEAAAIDERCRAAPDPTKLILCAVWVRTSTETPVVETTALDTPKPLVPPPTGTGTETGPETGSETTHGNRSVGKAL